MPVLHVDQRMGSSSLMGVTVVGVATAMLGILAQRTEAANVVAIDYRNI